MVRGAKENFEEKMVARTPREARERMISRGRFFPRRLFSVTLGGERATTRRIGFPGLPCLKQ